MEINSSDATVSELQFPMVRAHRQPQPGHLQAASAAKQHLRCLHPLLSALHNINIPMQSNCEIWVWKGSELEALKHIFKCLASLQTYFVRIFS